MSNAIATQEPKTFRDMITSDSYKREIGKALPKHLTADRLSRVVLTAMNRTPKLAECTPASMWEAVLNCASLGLEPGPLGHCYLIPFTNRRRVGGEWVSETQCQFMVGYRGLAELAYRSGQVESLGAEVVYSEDEFRFAFGMKEDLHHVPALKTRTDPQCAYSYCRLKSGGFKFVVMSVDEINAIRDRSQGYQQAVKASKEYNKPINSPWATDWGEMAKKTAFKRLAKMLPLSPELRDAISHEDDEEREAKAADVIRATDRFTADLGLPAPTPRGEVEAERIEDEAPVPVRTLADLAAAFDRCASATTPAEATDVLLKSAGKAKLADVPPEKIAAAIDALTAYIG